MIDIYTRYIDHTTNWAKQRQNHPAISIEAMYRYSKGNIIHESEHTQVPSINHDYRNLTIIEKTKSDEDTWKDNLATTTSLSGVSLLAMKSCCMRLPGASTVWHEHSSLLDSVEQEDESIN
jgi:hypothetical protein